MFSIALAIFCSITIGLALKKDSKKEGGKRWKNYYKK